MYFVYRLEAERKELQEKEDSYCRYLLKLKDAMLKYKSEMKVGILKICVIFIL